MNHYDTEASFFQAGGTLDPDSPSYVVREADEALLGLTLAGEYCNVLTARQTGKSSLMIRTHRRLHDEVVQTVVIDLASIGSQDITADGWYLGLVSEISRQLGLEIEEYRWWMAREPLGPVQRFTDFLKEVVLKRVSGRIVIFIDEIDSTLSLSFTDDFFVAIRALYNERASNSENRRLTFVLVGVALPSDLIKSRRRAPYNIGQTVDIRDFSRQNAKILLPGLKRTYPEQSEVILERVLYWTGGHPYLTQRVCAEMVEKRDEGWSAEWVDRLVERLFFQEGQIRQETNLQWIDDYIKGSRYREGMSQAYRAIISGQEVRDEERSIVKSQLKLSGLVKATPEGYLQVRNRIYERVFRQEWAESLGPVIPWRKVAIPALAAVLLIVIAAVTFSYRAHRDSTLTSPPEPSPSSTSTQVVVIVPTPTLLAPAETDTAISTSTSTATPGDRGTPTRAPTDTSTPTPLLTSIPAPTDTSVSTVTPTFIPTPADTSTPIATPTIMPTPTDTPTPIAIQIVIIPLPGSYSTAVSRAAIFAQPYADLDLLYSDSNVRGVVSEGESVQVIGRGAEPWNHWLYVRRDSDDLKGFVWEAFFEWQALEIVQIAYVPFCNEDVKMAGFEVQVRGGDGHYTFFWEDQEIGAIQLEEVGSYLVFWSWGSFSRVGTVTVVSGDGQRASQGDIYTNKPTCSP